jgi:hypothetical protein
MGNPGGPGAPAMDHTHVGGSRVHHGLMVGVSRDLAEV